MKLTLTLLIISLMHLSATTYAQHAKLSVSVKNESLEKIFKDIEEQSEFLFFYNAKDIDKNEKISLNKENSSIEEILKDIAAKTGIVYTIKDRHIVLTNHPEYLKAIADQSSKKQITGVVVDNTGESVVGANVVEKGTTNGVVTDIDGKFTLNVEDNAVLEITYIGYNPQEVPVKNRSSLTITLTENLQALEEVVVIGYGIQKKVNLTGSVATISSKEISSIPVSSISNAMAGRMPGVFSFNSSGLPGSSSPITIRGVNTPNSTSPTYVIDGVVRDKADFDALDPNEIESFWY